MNKEIEKIIRPEGDEDGSDDEKKKKGGKGSNVNRIMKNRLQKLITTNDETCVHSEHCSVLLTVVLIFTQWSKSFCCFHGPTLKKEVAAVLQDYQEANLL